MKNPINVIVVCHNSSGIPEIMFACVKATKQEVNNGDHYEMAKEMALEDGYSAPFVCFDNMEAPAFLMKAVTNGYVQEFESSVNANHTT